MSLKNYVLKNLWIQVVFSLIIGLAVGLVLGDDVGIGVGDDSLDSATSYLKIPASIFVSLIYMIIVPLIFSSIVVAVNSLGTTEKLKTLGLGVASYFVITTTIAILIAVSLGSIIAPGSLIDISALQDSYDLSDTDMEVSDGFSLDDIPNAVSSIIPRNPITSYLEGQMLSILVFALIIGLSMTAIPKESAKPLLDILDVKIERNSFGRQNDSFEAQISMEPIGISSFNGVFIRAPSISETGSDVEILAKFNEKIVAVKQGNVIATAFHPELTRDISLHKSFVKLVDNQS